MQIKLKLTESAAQIEKKIMHALSGEIVVLLNQIAPVVEHKVRINVQDRLYNCVEIKALMTGQLRSEIGLANPVVVNSIIGKWVDSVKVTPRRVTASGNRLRGGLDINMIQGDWQDVLTLPEATFISEGGHTIPWLEWLLLAGQSILVQKYNVIANPRASRTSNLIMVQKDISWRVPGQYAGTTNNNFVTRALQGIEVSIENIIEFEISKRV